MLHLDPEKLHHAYCIVGEREELLAEVMRFCNEDLEHKTQGNPDFWLGEFDSLGIDDGRTIKEMQEKKAFWGDKKIFVILVNAITHEAQNSLLKVFEEPTPGTHFFLIMPSVEVLLPTLRSRLQVIKPLGHSMSKSGGGVAAEFLKKSLAERLAFVKSFAEEISEGDKTKAEAILLLDGIEVLLRRKIGERVFTKDEVFLFDEILKCRDYMTDRSASVKMLLEHVALVL